MSKQNVSDLELKERREKVDTLDIIGIKPYKIYKELLMTYYDKERYASPYDTFWADVVAVRKARKTLLLDGKKDLALQEFISEQKEIFTRSILGKSYTDAIKASINIARARGIDLGDVPKMIELVFGNKTTVVSNTQVNVAKLLEEKDSNGRSLAEEWRDAYRRADTAKIAS